MDELHFGGWSAHYRSWSGNIEHLVRFEDLIKSPIGVMRAVCDCDRTVGELPAFDTLRKDHEWYYQRGMSGRWKYELPEHLVERCEKMHGQEMVELGYSLTNRYSSSDENS
jgi:hypothetical protein